MHFAGTLAVAGMLAGAVTAVPHSHARFHVNARRQSDSIQITVTNNCGFSQSAGLFQISPGFQMVSMSSATTLNPGDSTTISAPYNAIGMRLSGTADQGTAAQWNAQAFFEFGYSEYDGQSGVAYDLSVMNGSPSDVGIAVQPDNSNCESKSCSPGSCSSDQGWTDPSQDAIGSPADTTCYYGPTNFAVTFCP